MSDYHDLYQELIIDHGRHPRNFGVLEGANHVKVGFNPLCGDKLVIYLNLESEKVEGLKFEGSGCAISMASASMMTEALKGKTLDEAKLLFENFHQVVTGHADPSVLAASGKLKALAGVSEFPARVKCASLCWHTLKAALDANPVNEKPISTE